MELEKIKITDINPADYNPRRISDDEFLKLQNSISTFGVVDPIIINLKNNKIIGGHQRYDVLLDEYMKDGSFMEELHLLRLGDVGWVFPDTDLEIKSEDHEKALNLALNKISGEWDEPKLAELLEDLSLSDLDIELTGFDKLELTDLDIDLDDGSTDNDYDVVEDEYEAPVDMEVNVEMGDVFKLGNHILVCGDSTVKEYIDKLLKIGGRQININMILTDPPYGMFLNTDWSSMKANQKFYEEKCGTSGNTYNPVIGDNEDFTPELITSIFENFNEVKEIFLWGADYYSELIPDRKDGSWIVWDKRTNEGFTIEQGEKADKHFGSCFELCWSKKKHRREIARIRWMGLFGTEKEFDRKRVHPTQKPTVLNKWFLEKWSKEQDNILDLFGGSGSTLIACEQTNRNCYMMELDPYYCQVIINRWEEFTGKKAEKLN